ncbi:MAG TPA: hypothetical protein VLW85_19520 [Myxococcales bacterium]|nr:hypothetical protein [Myxococcales bacterium]
MLLAVEVSEGEVLPFAPLDVVEPDGVLDIEPEVLPGVCPLLAEAVPVVLPETPAVELVPSTELLCGVAVPLSFEAVRVFELPWLQPNASAAASARP